ncbi:MAG: VanW family protein [Anaerolineales bacterium]
MVTQPLSQQPIELVPPTLLSKTAAAFGAAFGLTALVGAVFSLSFSLFFLGRILPGVRVAGTDVSGLSHASAVGVISQQLSYPQTGSVVLSYGQRSWSFSPAELGLTLDANETARAAYAFGRSLWPWENISQKIQSLQGGADLAPRLVFDGQIAFQALQQIASQINQPTVEAELSVQGLQVQMKPGQVGLTLDTEKTASWLASQMLLMQDAVIPLAVIETPPRILDVSNQATIAQSMLSQALSIVPGGNYEDNPKPWAIEPQTLANMLSVERVETDTGAHYQIGLDPRELGGIIAGLGPQVAVEPRNARFIFNDETKQLDIYKPAVIGRTLDLDASIQHINQAIAEGAHEIELQYDYTEPEHTENVTAESLGITELVHEETTYYYGSSSERIQNITTASERFHGLLVPPGATFSMVENIGDISLESGFAEALIIFGDRTIKGVGGGVCQVSTTLFRTVFFAGFPIVERYPHAYRVGYYEMNAAGSTNTNLVGLDATVYAPIVDFKFQNDTPYWLLMETYSNEPARTLTWKFYSTSDGRSVEWDTSGIRNVEEAPDPVYEENPEFAKGVIKQVDWAAQGADVSITRWVTRDGQLLHEDFINTRYQAWAAVWQYGPGTENMPPKNVKGQDN